jgi:hypothetical protein
MLVEEPLFPPCPFWFASEELLMNCLHAEIGMVMQLLSEHPDVRNLFDVPEATVSQRGRCFTLRAHLKLVEIIDETFTGRYEPTPSLSEEESKALQRTHGLVARDAPAWALEINEAVELLPYRIKESLPQPLRKERFDEDDPAQAESLKTLSSVDQIRMLTEGVLGSQLQRLEKRWPGVQPATNVVREIVVLEQKSNKPKNLRTPDKQRIARDKLIFQIDDAAPTIHEFVKLMDERKVPPQLTWSGWPGSWSKAYKDPRFRKLIQQDKSRALVRVRRAVKR